MPNLQEKIANRTAHVAIIGLGYVGLPLATAFAKAGFRVTGVDVDQSKVDSIAAGQSYIPDVPDDELALHIRSGLFMATSDYDALSEADVIFICVPTPYDAQRAPDLSYIEAASYGIRPRVKPGQLIVLQSTTYPGTTEDTVQRILERSGLKAGVDFYLAFSPERIDPGNKQWSAYNTPKVVGGITPECTQLACDLLSQMGAPVHPVSSPRAAELTKLLENTFRAVNIALVNELALLAERMGIDFWEVIEAAKTKPFGFMPFYPGPGVGGHCLSPDEYLFLRNRNVGLETVTIGDYFQSIQTAPNSRTFQVQGTTLIALADTELLVFDPVQGRAIFKPLRYVSARPYDGRMVQVITADGRRLTVTDGHPMITLEQGDFLIKRADGLERGDALVVAKDLPQDTTPLSIDLIAELPESEWGRVRVKPKQESFSTYRAQLTPHLKKHLKYYWDVFKLNTMPLPIYIALEREGVMPIPHQDVFLSTGRGPSYGSIPAVLALDADFARLLGYYLSEGCLTADSSLRTRFTFNADERETIADLEAILKRIGLKYSAYKDRHWNSYHIKVSSRLFGLLLRDILQCGTNSYNMQIPLRLMTAPAEIRLELLSGLLRGDGDVHHTQETRSYQSQNYGSFATVQVREVAPAPPVPIVYSLETDDPHTFVTTYGLVVHNCIPVDPYYLSWKAREYDYYAEFIELAGEVNQAMPYHVVDLVSQALSLRRKPLRDARVLVLGVAFKPDIDDARNSPAERVIELLLSRGAQVAYHDPYVPRFQVGNDVFHREPVMLESVGLTKDEIAAADCVVIVTNHRNVDYEHVVRHADLVIDTRNATAGVSGPGEKIVRLGAPLVGL